MLERVHFENEKIFGLKLTGDYLKEDLEKIAPELMKFIKEKEEVYLYQDLNDFESLTFSGIFSEFVFFFKNFKNLKEFKKIKKVAVISEKPWIVNAVKVENKLDKKDRVRTFTKDQKEDIMKFFLEE
jgi:hypothetical protein